MDNNESPRIEMGVVAESQLVALPLHPVQAMNAAPNVDAHTRACHLQPASTTIAVESDTHLRDDSAVNTTRTHR